MQVSFPNDPELDAAAERVRQRGGDRGVRSMVRRLVLTAARGGCRVDRGGRECGAPIGSNGNACAGCILDAEPKRHKVAK